MSLKTLYDKIERWVVLNVIGKIRWKLKGGLTDADRAQIHVLLKDSYYVILTHRRNHLSTYFTDLGTFLVTGKWGFWGHALMNLEDQVDTVDDFRLVEAVGAGVEYTPFADVFDVDAVVLLKPKRVTLAEWTEAMDGAKSYLGEQYDTLFDLTQTKQLDCVELVLAAIKKIPGYSMLFADLLARITLHGDKLVPQMYYDSDDFEKVLEIRR